MGHVGLKAEGLRAVDHLQQLDHAAPTVHPAPTDLPLGSQLLAVVFGDGAGLAEGLGDLLLALLGSGVPGLDAAGRVDAHDAVGPHAQLAQAPGDAAALADLVEELLALLGGAHGGAAAGGRPDRRGDRADVQVPLPGLVGQHLDLVVAGVDVDVRGVEEEVEALEADAVHFGRGREVEHRVEVDGWLAAVALADHAGPGRVVELGIVVGVVGSHCSSSRVASLSEVTIRPTPHILPSPTRGRGGAFGPIRRSALAAGRDAVSIDAHVRLSRDPPRYGLQVFVNIPVGHAENMVSLLLEPTIAQGIAVLLIVVTDAVEFYDEFASTPAEVDDVRANRFLTPELQRTQPSTSKHGPE